MFIFHRSQRVWVWNWLACAAEFAHGTRHLGARAQQTFTQLTAHISDARVRDYHWIIEPIWHTFFCFRAISTTGERTKTTNDGKWKAKVKHGSCVDNTWSEQRTIWQTSKANNSNLTLKFVIYMQYTLNAIHKVMNAMQKGTWDSLFEHTAISFRSCLDDFATLLPSRDRRHICHNKQTEECHFVPHGVQLSYDFFLFCLHISLNK